VATNVRGHCYGHMEGKGYFLFKVIGYIRVGIHELVQLALGKMALVWEK
jgi:hypothetical protein